MATMQCPKCGSVLLPNSKFCEYCGSMGVEMQSEEKTVGVMNSVSIAENSIQQEKPKSKKKVPVWSVVLIVVLALLVIASAGGNVMQYLSGREVLETVSSQETEIEDLKKTISSNEDTIAAQEDTIAAHEGTIAALESKAGYYDELCSELDSGNIGYAASNFHVDESIVMVDKDEVGRQVTLTANWSNGGTVYVEYSSDAANVSFDNDEWSTSTTLTVNPQYEGITAVTFSNSVDYQTFKLLIIVTD